MADISNKTLGLVVAAALVVSVIGLFSLPGGMITGKLTTGQARLNITELSALNVSLAFIDFGNGTVKQGLVNCTLSTDIGVDPRGCFTPAFGNDGPAAHGFEMRNVGNTEINVTLTSTANNAATFFGVSGGQYKYRCNGNGTAEAGNVNWTEIDGSAQKCMGAVPATTGSDGFETDLNITIPNTATGFKNDTLLFTASKT